METSGVLIYLILVIASAVVYLLRRNLSYWKRLGIPHEEPTALMGNMNGLRTQRCMGDILADYYRKFKGCGPFAGIFNGQRPGVVLLDKQLIKQVLIKDFTQFTDRGLYYNEKSDPLTGHLFFLDGDKWRNLRNKLSPTFTSGKMKYMYPTVVNVAERFMEVLAQKVRENPIVDVRDMLGRFTVDVIASVAFGIECNSLRNAEDKFLQLGRKSIEVQRHNALIMTLIDGFPRLSRMLGMRTLPQDVHEFFMQTIRETVEYRERNKIQRSDFLNILIELKNTVDDKSGLGGMELEELAAQVFVFFLAGFETSSSTMAYALYELAQNQQIQERLREEINEAFEGDTKPSYETIMNLSYLDQVISETLRKYPILPFLNRQALNDYVVPGHPKFRIPKGTPIFIPVMGIQHDPEFYPQPDEFDPERFSPDMVKQRDSIEWMPFGDGPRNCIGARFAKMQTRLGLACVLKYFRVVVCSKTPLHLTFQAKPLVLTPRHDVYLKLEAI
ncbi:cytochrome P450 6A1-like [Musca domestica]|uniref:Cytochrome P450 6A1-like n=1 Tax=Musca domestica TaxID=7370 RepID=A0ABM3V1G7_MUSDO|nr:cytochrome P450 6A1-like [Musca domestica]